MAEIIYLDNSSTTKPCKESIKAVDTALSENWGNPSSLHILGMKAEETVNNARNAVASLLKVRDDEIYFTGSGTEGNNTAILGAAFARAKRGNRIVTTSVEHPSVLETVKRLEETGFEVIRVSPDKDGVVDPNKLEAAINDKTVLVSMMLVNNETGAIMPVQAAKQAILKKRAPALLHCDGVQAFGKMPIDPNSLGADLFTASAHKIHGPKGIGVLYIKKGVTVKPLITGGGQERGMRSGTESVPLAAGMGAAISALIDPKTELKKIKELNLYARKALLETGLVRINSSEEALPYILNISVLGYRSETLLHFLENRKIFVSSGSACAKGKGSYVLKECGFDKRTIDSALRLSFSRYNKKEEIDVLAAALRDAAATLRRADL